MKLHFAIASLLSGKLSVVTQTRHTAQICLAD